MELLLLGAAFILSVSAAPQGAKINLEDAEFIPADVPRGASSPGSNARPFPRDLDVHFIDIPVRRPTIFDLLFGTAPFDENDGTVVAEVDVLPAVPEVDPLDDRMHIFPSFLTRIFGRVPFPSVFSRAPEPDFPIFHDFRNPVFPDFIEFPDLFDLPSFGSIPNNFKNSTYEVNFVNDTRVEVNKTVTKDGNSGFIFTKVLLSRSPSEDGGSSGGDNVSKIPISPESPPGNVSSSSTQIPQRETTSLKPVIPQTQTELTSSVKPLSIQTEATPVNPVASETESTNEIDPTINQVEPEVYEDFS